MDMKINKIKDVVLPNKKINYFILSIMLLGIICGSIFFTIISKTDKAQTIELIKNFFVNVNNSSIDSGLALKNSLITNGILVTLIFILGMSVIGLILNVFIVYIKGFVLGFSISSIIGTYGLKGIIAAFIYIFPHQIINIIAICIIGIYSIMFSIYLIKLITNKKSVNSKNIFRKYFIIFAFSLISVTIASFCEAYILPAFLKLIIGLYVN